MTLFRRCLFALAVLLQPLPGGCQLDAGEPTDYRVGAARIEITPQESIRLSG